MSSVTKCETVESKTKKCWIATLFNQF